RSPGPSTGSAELPRSTGARRLSRRTAVLAGLLLLLHAALLTLDARVSGAATDEPAYFHAARIIHERGWVHPQTWLPGPPPLFANQLLVPALPPEELAHEQPDAVLFRARLGMLPFALLSAALVFLWAWRLFGEAGALLALVLHALNPLMLGYGATILVDSAHA